MIIKTVKWWKGEYVKSPSHSSNPIDFSNIFILIKRTIYDMQIHNLVERSSSFIHVFRAQSKSHAGHFLLYKNIQFSLQQWRHDRKPTFKILLPEVMAVCFSSEHYIYSKICFFYLCCITWIIPSLMLLHVLFMC